MLWQNFMTTSNLQHMTKIMMSMAPIVPRSFKEPGGIVLATMQIWMGNMVSLILVSELIGISGEDMKKSEMKIRPKIWSCFPPWGEFSKPTLQADYYFKNSDRQMSGFCITMGNIRILEFHKKPKLYLPLILCTPTKESIQLELKSAESRFMEMPMALCRVIYTDSNHSRTCIALVY